MAIKEKVKLIVEIILYLLTAYLTLIERIETKRREKHVRERES